MGKKCKCPACELASEIEEILAGRPLEHVYAALTVVLGDVISNAHEPSEALAACQEKLGDMVNDGGRTLQ